MVATGILFVGATSAFAELKGSLDEIWQAPVDHSAGWLAAARPPAVLQPVLVLAFMLLVS